MLDPTAAPRIVIEQDRPPEHGAGWASGTARAVLEGDGRRLLIDRYLAFGLDSGYSESVTSSFVVELHRMDGGFLIRIERTEDVAYGAIQKKESVFSWEPGWKEVVPVEPSDSRRSRMSQFTRMHRVEWPKDCPSPPLA